MVKVETTKVDFIWDPSADDQGLYRTEDSLTGKRQYLVCSKVIYKVICDFEKGERKWEMMLYSAKGIIDFYIEQLCRIKQPDKYSILGLPYDRIIEADSISDKRPSPKRVEEVQHKEIKDIYLVGYNGPDHKEGFLIGIDPYTDDGGSFPQPKTYREPIIKGIRKYLQKYFRKVKNSFLLYFRKP